MPKLKVAIPKIGTVLPYSKGRKTVVVLDTATELLSGLEDEQVDVVDVVPPLDIPEAKTQAPEKIRRPRGFAHARDKLRKELGEKNPLAAARETESRLRRHFLTILDGLLAPSVRKSLPGILNTLVTIDAKIYEDAAAVEEKTRRDQTGKREQAPVFPVLAVEDGTRLGVAVHNVRVRVQGGAAGEAESFRERLAELLRGQDYLVLAPR
jgi:hypothetical protein